jgi:hypothetical protein
MSASQPEFPRALVVGWFSFVDGHATAGDLLSRDLACEWLGECGWAYDVATAPPFAGDVELESADPAAYSHVVFVCGPFQQGELEARLLRRFGHRRLIGVNLSMGATAEGWQPFDLLIERDSSARTNADIVFLSRRPLVPVAGVCLVEDYPGALVDRANTAIARLAASRSLALVRIDTRLDRNDAGLRTPAEVESLIARMDVILTTRLHGMVLALKNGVPVIAIDPEAGGAKIRRQAGHIGWPVAFSADEVAPEALAEALDYCLSEPARVAARRCGERAAAMVEALRDSLIAALRQPEELECRYAARRAAPPDDRWMVAADEAAIAPPAPRPETRPGGGRIARLLRRDPDG